MKEGKEEISLNPRTDLTEGDAVLKKQQTIELAMLKECIHICERHRIRYFLLAGSALGAVRHAGFIPWDDDIDVGLPRPDYEKFLRVAQSELGPDLFVQTHETDPMYPLNFAKIRNPNTTFIQSAFSDIDMNHGLFIDIFPLDGCPSNKLERLISRTFLRICRASILHKLGGKKKASGIGILIGVYACFSPLSRLRRRLEKLMTQRAYDHSDVVVSWCGAWGLKEAVPRKFFGEGKRVQFEGITVNIPTDYDGYLKSLYGDYLTLPRIQDRISHHLADIIDLESPYTDHFKRHR